MERVYRGFGRFFITVSNKPTEVITAKGATRTTEQATVYVKDLSCSLLSKF